MSATKAIDKAKKKAAAAAAAGEEGATTAAPSEENNIWRVIATKDVAVVQRGKDKNKTLEVIRRTKGPDGKYVNPKKDSGEVFASIDATFRLSTKSSMAGEGNLGEGKDYEIHRGNCQYNVGCAKGNLKDGKPRPGLLEAQDACMEWNYAMSRHIMGCVFDLAPEGWEGPIAKAVTAAREQLFSKFKDASGREFQNYMQLEELEGEDTPAGEEAHKRVMDLAREKFIDGAKSLPGAKKADRSGTVREPILWITRKVYPFEKFDPKRDAMSQEKGPVLSEYPSDLDHWMSIQEQMTDPKGRMRRKYSTIEYIDNDSKLPLLPNKVKVVEEKIDKVTGEKVRVAREINNPFFNPCLKTPSGKLAESLIACKKIWSVFRGPKGTNDNYGIHQKLASAITIVCKAKRKADNVIVEEDWATGVGDADIDTDDEADVEEDEEGEVQEPKVGEKRRATDDAGAPPGKEAKTTGEAFNPEQVTVVTTAIAQEPAAPPPSDTAQTSSTTAKLTVRRARGAPLAPNEDDDDAQPPPAKKGRLTKKAGKAKRADVADEDISADDGVMADN